MATDKKSKSKKTVRSVFVAGSVESNPAADVVRIPRGALVRIECRTGGAWKDIGEGVVVRTGSGVDFVRIWLEGRDNLYAVATGNSMDQANVRAILPK